MANANESNTDDYIPNSSAPQQPSSGMNSGVEPNDTQQQSFAGRKGRGGAEDEDENKQQSFGGGGGGGSQEEPPERSGSGGGQQKESHGARNFAIGFGALCLCAMMGPVGWVIGAGILAYGAVKAGIAIHNRFGKEGRARAAEQKLQMKEDGIGRKERMQYMKEQNLERKERIEQRYTEYKERKAELAEIEANKPAKWHQPIKAIKQKFAKQSYDIPQDPQTNSAHEHGQLQFVQGNAHNPSDVMKTALMQGSSLNHTSSETPHKSAATSRQSSIRR